MAQAATQRSTLNVGAGLYVLRYLGSIDPRNAPRAHVTPQQSSDHDIDIVGAPGTQHGELTHPGSSLVIVVRKAGVIEVVVNAVENSNNVDARLTLDLVASAVLPASRDARSNGVDRVKAEVPRRQGAAPSLAVQAHVARRGDIMADGDGWIAGPEAPAAIEGLQIDCDDPEIGVVGQYRNTQARDWSRWSQPGHFIGTEQKASALTGLRLKLTGASASAYALEVRSIFLGSPLQTQKGVEIEIVSPGDLDPLIGLNLRLVAVEPPKFQELPKAPRVRVFR